MNVNRYFHIRTPDSAKKKFTGATVKVSGNTEYVGHVDVQVTFCSKKDLYCKATGRAKADAAPIKVVALRYLPNELARIEDHAFGFELENKQDFLFAMKYFLPKE
jgi:NADH:ubiquinone oxidoreductase subunit D